MTYLGCKEEGCAEIQCKRVAPQGNVSYVTFHNTTLVWIMAAIPLKLLFANIQK